MVPVEELKAPVERVVADLVEDRIDERLGRDDRDLDVRVQQPPHHQLAYQRAPRDGVYDIASLCRLENAIRDGLIDLVEAVVAAIEVVTAEDVSHPGQFPCRRVLDGAHHHLGVRIEEHVPGRLRDPVEIAGAQAGDGYHPEGGTTCGVGVACQVPYSSSTVTSALSN
jgi:hypothetical protein